MNDPASGSGSKGGTGGRPAVPAPGSPETPQPPGRREVPAPGTPTDRDTLRRLKEDARKPAPSRPPGQPDRS